MFGREGEKRPLPGRNRFNVKVDMNRVFIYA